MAYWFVLTHVFKESCAWKCVGKHKAMVICCSTLRFVLPGGSGYEVQYLEAELTNMLAWNYLETSGVQEVFTVLMLLLPPPQEDDCVGINMSYKSTDAHYSNQP